VTKGNAYNLGSGEKITIGKLVNKILEKISTNIKIEYKEKTFPEINNQYLDSTKIRKAIGWKAQTTLDEGLEKTIADYKEKLLRVI
jgi:nucleoside-diphosphate-sugar epimerase